MIGMTMFVSDVPFPEAACLIFEARYEDGGGCLVSIGGIAGEYQRCVGFRWQDGKWYLLLKGLVDGSTVEVEAPTRIALIN